MTLHEEIFGYDRKRNKVLLTASSVDESCPVVFFAALLCPKPDPVPLVEVYEKELSLKREDCLLGLAVLLESEVVETVISVLDSPPFPFAEHLSVLELRAAPAIHFVSCQAAAFYQMLQKNYFLMTQYLLLLWYHRNPMNFVLMANPYQLTLQHCHRIPKNCYVRIIKHYFIFTLATHLSLNFEEKGELLCGHPETKTLASCFLHHSGDWSFCEKLQKSVCSPITLQLIQIGGIPL
ncbi:hypothetical protein E2C01_041480 [Portunus trituberculatus]|uniref:Uncharacterized protein n=1 Tax=Portunus trituberculatus TaxID=210409 RepID=A0A5B7FQR4_PORTR|nr:hypothetical protein [Portunus trituberculatus]